MRFSDQNGVDRNGAYLPRSPLFRYSSPHAQNRNCETPRTSTTKTNITSLHANLRLLRKEVKKLLDLSERILTKRWECQYLRQRKPTRLKKKRGTQEEPRRTVTPNFCRENSIRAELGRCHSVDVDWSRNVFWSRPYPFSYEVRERRLSNQFNRNNSAALDGTDSPMVRLSQSTQRTVKHENYQDQYKDGQSEFSASDFLRPSRNEPDYVRHSLKAPERKSTLKMFTVNNRPNRPTLEISSVKNNDIFKDEHIEKSMDSEELALKKLILELSDDDVASSVPEKTTVQFSFHSPAVKDAQIAEPFSESIVKDNRDEVENSIKNQGSRRVSDVSRNTSRQSIKSTNLELNRPSYGHLSEPVTKEETRTSSRYEFTRNRPYSAYSRPQSIKSKKVQSPCYCARVDRTSASWYDPILCNCAYEQEAKRLSTSSTRNRGPNKSTKINSSKRGEKEMDKIGRLRNRNSFKPHPRTSITQAFASPERSLSMDTIDMLDAIEKPEVIDNISRHQLEKEIEKAYSPNRNLQRQYPSDSGSSPVGKEIVPVTGKSQPVSAQSPFNQTTYILPVSYPNILYHPVAQPTACTGIWPQSCIPTISPSNMLVQSSPTSVITISQTCPPPPVYGAYATPTLSPTILQQTVFLPNTFHILSYQPMWNEV